MSHTAMSGGHCRAGREPSVIVTKQPHKCCLFGAILYIIVTCGLNLFLLPNFLLLCVWPQHGLSMYFLFSVCVCVCARVCMWRYNSHHYLSQYPHVHVLIMLSMSNEVSQAAESLVDLFGLLLRPHSEIKCSWATSRARLLALSTAGWLYKQHQIHNKAANNFIS